VCPCVFREALARDGQGGPDWGKLKKGKAIAKGPGNPGLQYQLKHFELVGEGQVKQFDQPQAVELLGLAPGEISGRRISSGAGPGEGLEGDDGRGLTAGTSKAGGKDRKTSRMGLVTFTKPVADVTVHEGKTATFECNISDAEATVKWYVNDQAVPSQRAQILGIGKNRRLVLKDCLLKENDSKVTCELDEETKSHGQLYVKEAPFEFTDPLKNLKAKRGLKCEFQCTCNKLNVTLEWLKDGQPITDIKEEVDEYIHRLIIPSTQDKDKGVYVAKFQDVQTECQMDVLGKYNEKQNFYFVIINCYQNSEDEQSQLKPLTGKRYRLASSRNSLASIK
jgi:hypothetical protein